MREILFRGKRVDNGEWIEGGYAENGGKTFIIVRTRYIPDARDWDTVEYYENNPCYHFSMIEVDPETVCQYTGYKDDTGKKIFEGDIVGFEDMTSTESGYSEMGCCGKVCYDEEEVCFHVTDRLSAESWEVLGECHIIGNIFDNPELIGE